MARIAGVNIPNHQHAEIALTAIYGIGRPRAKAICVAAGVPQGAKIKDLTDAQMDKLRENISKFTVSLCGSTTVSTGSTSTSFAARLSPAIRSNKYQRKSCLTCTRRSQS
jgi:ribosomal protein S13